MIFVSSSCVKNERIKDSVLELATAGFKNIELSGGTNYYSEYMHDLLELQNKYSLQYLLHNYFPPPQEHFMLNLSSLDDVLYQRSINHCKRAITLCKKLGSKKYGVHAGFLIDFLPSESGKKIGLRRVNRRQDAYSRFADAWSILKELAGDDLELYVENNVLSKSNVEVYKQNNPFLFTDYKGWLEFSEKVDCKLLLDLAHLKVSSTSLELDFNKQVDRFINLTDYYHISGNDGLHDQNHSLAIDNDMLSILDNYDWSNKTFTIEIYEGIDTLHENFDLLNSKCNSNSNVKKL
jgi:sugar phosphate isomerase/epimerase